MFRGTYKNLEKVPIFFLSFFLSFFRMLFGKNLEGIGENFFSNIKKKKNSILQKSDKFN